MKSCLGHAFLPSPFHLPRVSLGISGVSTRLPASQEGSSARAWTVQTRSSNIRWLSLGRYRNPEATNSCRTPQAERARSMRMMVLNVSYCLSNVDVSLGCQNDSNAVSTAVTAETTRIESLWMADDGKDRSGIRQYGHRGQLVLANGDELSTPLVGATSMDCSSPGKLTKRLGR